MEESLGTKIYNLRRSKGITQEELAAALHVSRQSVSNWERGLSVPNSDKLLELCQIFGVGMDEFLSVGEDNVSEPETGITDVPVLPKEIPVAPSKTEAAVSEAPAPHRAATLIKRIILIGILLVVGTILCIVCVALACNLAAADPEGETVYAFAFSHGPLVLLVVGIILTAIVLGSVIYILIRIIKGKNDKRF